MLNRFANVVYWLCTGLAVLCAALAVAIVINAKADDYFGTVFFAVMAPMFFGIGRAVRYVIAGR